MWRLIFSGLWYHRRLHLGAALAAAVATAVLTGALVVGDSMRGSLTHLALDRLGKIDDMLVADRFFRAALAKELSAEPGYKEHYQQAVAAIVIEGSLEQPDRARAARVGKVLVLGVEGDFWSLDTAKVDKPLLRPDEVLLNQPLANELGVSADSRDELLLRVGSVSSIPADSPLGEKTETLRNRRLTVAGVLPAEGLARFSLRPSQQTPRVAFVSRETLTRLLEQPDKANALFVAAKAGDNSGDLTKLLKPTLADFGYELRSTERGYLNFSSSRMMIEPSAERAALAALANQRPRATFAYLANSLKGGKGEAAPYSTIVAVDFSADRPLGPFLTTEGKPATALEDNEIAINQWTADRMDAKLGDSIEVAYFEPESTHGVVREKTKSFTLAAILPIEGAAADRQLVPDLPGVTDRLTISDWQAPFPFDRTRVHKPDEQYWEKYRTIPKAFISLAAGRALWSSRFGRSTSLQMNRPVSAEDAKAEADALARRIELRPAEFGFAFRPIRKLSLAASTGTTPFDALFFGFSMFIVASAMMLIALLFRLGVEQRASEAGMLEAMGFSLRKITRLFVGEALFVTTIGSVLGVPLGVGYAWLMLLGLKTWWVRAITTPFLRLYATPLSLAIGFLIGSIVGVLMVLCALRGLGKFSVRQLLSGDTSVTPAARSRRGWLGPAFACAASIGAIGLAAAGAFQSGEAQAGAFFTSGALALAGILTFASRRLAAAQTPSLAVANSWPMFRLALRSAARNPGRSTLTISLVAAASFLIVAIGAFQLDPAAEARGKHSGSGGFDVVAESTQPIYRDVNTSAGRQELGLVGDSDQNNPLAKCETIAFRVQPGDDASCLNLYQPTQARALGVPDALIERGGFAWAASAASTPEEKANPWSMLTKPLTADGADKAPLPVIIDAATAMYSLHLYQGIGEQFDIKDERGETVRLQVVGLLKNSLFQGLLLLGEPDFLRHFPSISGYRFFLTEAPGGRAAVALRALESGLGDYGFDGQTTVERLDDLLAVQNTYLATFQTLGGLGLLLGAVGVAAVQLRNVLQRRGELALLRAAGFRCGWLTKLVSCESALLLTAGLAAGVLAALIAVGPHLVQGSAAVPWLTLIATLLAVLIVGLTVGFFSVRSTMRAPITAALRGE